MARTKVLKCSRYVIFSPIFMSPKSESLRQIAFSTFSGEWYVFDPTTADMLANSEISSLPELLVAQLIKDRFLVADGEDEIAHVLSQNTYQDVTSEEYILTLMPSAFCQMGCSYCGQSHSKTHMNTDIHEAILRFVRNQFLNRTYRNMNVTWFGGEPLTGIAGIRALTPHLRDICAEASARFRASVITNGLLLTPQMINELYHELGVRRLQVTLDGPREIHDRRRSLKNGTGTYDKIMDNLRTYAQDPIPDLQLHIRVNVDANNSLHLQELIQNIIDANLVRAITKLYIASVFEWGNGGGQHTLPNTEFAEVELKFLRYLRSHKIPVEYLPERTTHTCPTYYRDDSPLIDPRGNLYSCYEYPLARDSDDTPIGRSGDVFAGTNETKLQNQVQLPILMSEIANDPDDCLNCNMLPVCGGTCEPYRLNGRKQCPGYKYNLGERLILAYEGLEESSFNDVNS